MLPIAIAARQRLQQRRSSADTLWNFEHEPGTAEQPKPETCRWAAPDSDGKPRAPYDLQKARIGTRPVNHKWVSDGAVHRITRVDVFSETMPGPCVVADVLARGIDGTYVRMKRVSIQDLKAQLSAAIVWRRTRSFVLRDLTLDLCQSIIMPAVATPRSLDLAHLRTALWFHGLEPIDRYLTMDESQAEAAKELGLPV